VKSLNEKKIYFQEQEDALDDERITLQENNQLLSTKSEKPE
jgi:hypothetical protein